MRQTMLDRAIASVAPRYALARMEARARTEIAGQLAGEASRLLDGHSDGVRASTIDPRNTGAIGEFGTRRRWGALGRDARGDTLPYLRYDRANSRDLARTSPIAAGAIQTNVDRVVGTGMALSANPNVEILGWSSEYAAQWKRKTQAEFSMWADSKDCDITGQLNFYELQGLTLRSALESGDVLSLLPDASDEDMKLSPMQPYRLRIQTIEADRVGNEAGAADSAEIAGGIKIDKRTGRPVEAFIYDAHPGGLPLAGSGAYKGKWQKFRGDSGRLLLLHHMQKKRPDLPRGLPYLSPIVESLKQISRYTEAEIMAAVITSYFTVFVESPAGTGNPIHGLDQDPVGDDVALGPGATVGLAPGEEVKFANPLRPNPNFDKFMSAVMKQMGMALGLPYELLVKQFNSSYTASRAALLDAGVYLRGVRNWLALSFCQPIYETWLTEAVILGRVKAPGFFTDPLLRWAYTRAMWPGDSMGSLNPKDEIAAYLDAVEGRLMTREKAQWELFGTDFNEDFATKQAEEKRLADADMLPAARPGAAPAAAKPTAAPKPPGESPDNPPADPADPENDDEGQDE